MNTYIKLEWTKYPTQKAEIVRLDLKKKKKKDPIIVVYKWLTLNLNT